ncbi:molybdopterin dinucleotide binding domain-containing protein [Desulfosarcina ovata]|uniref:Fe-S-cluster-containing hydrogenase n=1 Tax=Desulfosarcina ovata subsp. ovata TaxID=2752305 RepID=A0A5K8AG31_9BACT|nr:4Fe-4S dicluster domain-containing protein [Desulfosarcina ovata]BBO91436.1 Fe-S-cluster-containing hydrogenase [Desulfosarcina ovata subsp. ovata]
MNRRTFLKITSMGSVAFAAGCSAKTEDNLFTMVQATEDMVTGRANWYASTCRECPAGCGVLAKNREGRVIKLEGNPLHPVNRGTLCIRGQAALQGVYHPDRLTLPQLKTKDGWESLPYYKAAELVAKQFRAAIDKGDGRVAMLTETVGRTQLDLFATVMQHAGAAAPVVFEPLAYEALKFAHTELCGAPILPSLHLDQADVLVGFGADFLETWLSPVEYARKFKAMHGYKKDDKGRFLQVSPFQSLTGANADRWIACRPGSEPAVIMGLIQIVMGDANGRRIDGKLLSALADLTGDHTPEAVAKISGVSPKDLTAIARQLIAARRPLVLGAGAASSGKAAVATELAALFLNLALDPALPLFDFASRHRVEIADRRAAVNDFFDNLQKNDVKLVLLNNINPVFTLPDGGRIAKILGERKRFVVAFDNFLNETTAQADLIIPVQMALETWDAYESNTASLATLQPAMGRINRAPAIGDLFLDLLPAEKRPAENYQALVTRTVLADEAKSTTAAWLKTVQQGGRFADTASAANTPQPNLKAAATLKRCLADLPAPYNTLTLLAPPSIRFFDGRGANRPWLIETPDPLTQIPWQTPVLIHPETMAAGGIKDGDRVTLKTEAGTIEAPAYGYAGLFPQAIVVPTGQGHTGFGRWASGQGVNPLALLAAATDPDAGAPAFATVLSSLEKRRQHDQLAITSGSRTALHRKIAPTVAMDEIGHRDAHGEPALTMDTFPLTPPTPEGYDPKRDIYPPHDHAGYRWAMIVDVDRCIGCSACVAACYAENNIGIVGEQRIIEGREMAWLQIQRYHDPADMARMTFLPMMCQHCDNAPCEAVCPVYAPHHSKEGLNNQIYNRCIGTRFCAQNCPYKVRRFNWFDWKWPEPLNMQLNPWVTVRSKGVMEKCSFCVQRIKRAHNAAKNEKRAIRDGEVVPACAQTCPTGALTFGSLMDPDSRVSRMIKDPRAYQVMGYLNTKPAVIYLKKVVQEV